MAIRQLFPALLHLKRVISIKSLYELQEEEEEEPQYIANVEVKRDELLYDLSQKIEGLIDTKTDM